MNTVGMLQAERRILSPTKWLATQHVKSVPDTANPIQTNSRWDANRSAHLVPQGSRAAFLEGRS